MRYNKYKIHCCGVHAHTLNATENGRGVATASLQQMQSYAGHPVLIAASYICVAWSSCFCAIAPDSTMPATDTAHFSSNSEYRFNANSHSYLHDHTLLKRVEAAASDIDAVAVLISQSAEVFLGLEVSL